MVRFLTIYITAFSYKIFLARPLSRGSEEILDYFEFWYSFWKKQIVSAIFFDLLVWVSFDYLHIYC